MDIDRIVFCNTLLFTYSSYGQGYGVAYYDDSMLKKIIDFISKNLIFKYLSIIRGILNLRNLRNLSI